MTQQSRYILSIAAGIGCISILYFLCIAAHIPFLICLPVTATSLFFMIRWMNRRYFEPEEKIGRFSFYVLVAGVFIITNKVYYIAGKHGGWDAWAIWNLHARYLCDPVHWRNMFLNTAFAHPDYPLALPATIAFFSRMVGGYNELVSFGIHFLITLCIPVLIFFEVRRKSIIIAGLALLLFATNEFYLLQGTYQMADTLLAFFFLCALVCINHHKEDKRMLILSAAFLGCCMWTKNEGVILAVIFMLFHPRELFSIQRIKFTAMGLAIPLATWAFYKLAYAPPNDMMSTQAGSVAKLLTDAGRYKLIKKYFVDNLQYFKDLQWGIAIYIVLCFFRRQYPDKQIVMVFTCLLAYMMIYVVTPYSLEWHLFTSQSRLMHQLMPALMYLLAMKFSGDRSTATFQARFVSGRQHLR